MRVNCVQEGTIHQEPVQAKNPCAVEIEAFLRVLRALNLLANGVAEHHPDRREGGESNQRRFLETQVVGRADFAAH